MAAEVIWSHDNELLQNALSFYDDLRSKLGLEKEDYFKLNEMLQSDKAPKGFNADIWNRVRASHAGFEAGMELFGMIFLFGHIQMWNYAIGVGSAALVLGVMLLEIIVAFVQAYVFTLITAVLIGVMQHEH